MGSDLIAKGKLLLQLCLGNDACFGIHGVSSEVQDINYKL
jgi:hypothetical protein